MTTEFATRHPGPTTTRTTRRIRRAAPPQARRPGRAAGFFHAGFGTQTAGSIIRPAAFCGAVGFKPSFGTLHRAGMKVMAESLDTIGVITGSVGDAALAMAGLTGGDYGDAGGEAATGAAARPVLGPDRRPGGSRKPGR